MSAPPSTVLSEHSVHVPPRQTVHVAAELSEEAASVVLTKVDWPSSNAGRLSRSVTTPREALFLGIARSDAHALAPGKTSFDVPAHKALDVAVGNWSDCPLEVTFEIWGKP